MDDFWDSALWIIVVILFCIVLAAGIVWFVYAQTDTTPLAGSVTKLYSTNSGGYATVRLSDDTLQTVELSLFYYGLLSEGETCTFQVNHFQFVNSMDCQQQKR